MPIVYGLRKLQMTCVVEDDKVLVDDIVDQIQSYDDIVQVCISRYLAKSDLSQHTNTLFHLLNIRSFPNL